MLKKSIALALASVLAMSACDSGNSSAPTPPAASTPTSTQSASAATASSTPTANAESLRVVTEAAFAPFEFRDEKGLVIGFDADIINAVAADQGLSIQIIHRAWNGILESLDSGDSDIVMGALGSNEERKAKYGLSDSYAVGPNAFLVNDPTFTQLAQMSGKAVGHQKGSTALEDLKKLKIDVKPVGLDSSFLAVRALLTKEVQAVLGDKLSLAHTVNGLPEADKVSMHFIDLPTDDTHGLVFAVKKDNTELLQKINTGLANIKKNGTYDKIYVKWFGTTE